MSGTLVVRLDSLGDVLLAGPAVRAAAALDGPVALLCGPRGRAAAELLPGVDRLLELHCPWIDAEPPPVDRAALERTVEEVRGLAPDRAAILGSFHQSPLPTALLLRLAGVPEIAAISVDHAGTLLDHRLADPGDVHEVERALLPLAALGAPTGDDVPRLAVRRDPTARPDGLPAEYVVVHPGASVPARAWHPERHRELVALLCARGHHVVVTGDPAERALGAYVCGGAFAAGEGPPPVDLAGRTSLRGLAEVLAGARAVVVGNTGPAHLAAAVGTPVVSLFAPTVPAVRWAPWGVPQVQLGRDVPCAGCRARRCPVDGHPCLDALPADEVAAALEQLLADVSSPRSPSPPREPELLP